MISQTQTTSFKAELYQGIHDLTTDVLKLALYSAEADLGADTTAYTPTGEIAGTGYSAGGALVTGATVSSSGTTAWVSFSDVTWDPAVFTARGALLYNSSKSDRAIAVLDFGADKTAAATFSVAMPPNTPTGALIRSSN